MAVTIETWNTRRQETLTAPVTPTQPELSRRERVARLQRRRRAEQARAAIESMAWLAGGGLVLFFVWAGLFGLR